jgi:HD-like signal output (HDOD) protein
LAFCAAKVNQRIPHTQRSIASYTKKNRKSNIWLPIMVGTGPLKPAFMRKPGLSPQQAGIELTKDKKELHSIQQTLDALQSRVMELNDPAEASVSVASPTAVAEPVQDSTPYPSAANVVTSGHHDQTSMDLLRQGIAELSGYSKLKDFPEFFSKLAGKTGLRMLLLKRWTSGLQVFMEKNIKMPADAKRKGRDGRAPIPSSKNDLFQAIGDEAAIYSGPVPVKHFPLDLTIMLGRGSTDREIIILPLPSQNHWNTFLYLDADDSGIGALEVAGVLAHFALARMCLLNKGVRSTTGRVNAIHQAELFRRGKNQKKRQSQQTAPVSEPTDGEANDGFPDVSHGIEDIGEPLQFLTPPRVGPAYGETISEFDPFQVDSTPEPIPLIPSGPSASSDSLDGNIVEHALPEKPDLTPELILNQSGELPALPKAACHIMAVIEDPKTTATRLEKALAMDQTLTAKVLRIANSPFYGAVREIRTVSEAIVRLGFVTIRNWTVVTATKSVFLAPGAGSLYQKIWRQSVLSAMAGQLVGQALGTREPEGLFIGGLMQNIGQLVLARSHPQLFQEILAESESSGRPYHEVERELLGFDHGALGALLIKDWNLSLELEQAVRWHHDFENENAEQATLAAMIALGEEIASCSGSALPEESEKNEDSDSNAMDPVAETMSPACKHLGMSREKYNKLLAQAAELRIDPHFFS